jgi:hypothetical protein
MSRRLGRAKRWPLACLDPEHSHTTGNGEESSLMSFNVEFVRRAARLRAPLVVAILLAFTACDTSNPTDPFANTDPVTVPDAVPETGVQPSFVTAYQGGIPFGHFGMPITAFGSVHSGSKNTVEPTYILNILRDTKARGGKMMLMLAGRDVYYKDANGHFSFTKWKARIDRFRKVDFSSYIKDGTIIGHYMIDEPQDKANWNGTIVPGSTLEAMAKYSKSIWPGLTTIVRAPPGKIGWSGTYHYLDAAWAQVANPWGTLNVDAFVSQNISAAKNEGLQLVVGLNISKGGYNRSRMTPTQIKSWGSKLLSSSYPCAFISWTYDSDYLSRSTVLDALRYLRSKAQNRTSKSCRG